MRIIDAKDHDRGGIGIFTERNDDIPVCARCVGENIGNRFVAKVLAEEGQLVDIVLEVDDGVLFKWQRLNPSYS
jgi:hypothetical protein